MYQDIKMWEQLGLVPLGPFGFRLNNSKEKIADDLFQGKDANQIAQRLAAGPLFSEEEAPKIVLDVLRHLPFLRYGQSTPLNCCDICRQKLPSGTKPESVVWKAVKMVSANGQHFERNPNGEPMPLLNATYHICESCKDRLGPGRPVMRALITTASLAGLASAMALALYYPALRWGSMVGIPIGAWLLVTLYVALSVFQTGMPGGDIYPATDGFVAVESSFPTDRSKVKGFRRLSVALFFVCVAFAVACYGPHMGWFPELSTLFG